jgi:shikimate dehydrogenase
LSIKGTTKVYAIFGHPVSHSLSPQMHNAAFGALGLDCVYIAFDVQPKDFEVAARAIRSMGISGVNITIPHKESIIFFLDEISPEASLIGAVNTVKNEDGKLTGYNTDVGGFLRSIKDLGFEPKGLSVTVLGAGGAARAVLSALCIKEASEIYVINRTFDKAKKLTSEFKRNFKDTQIHAVSLDDKDEMEKSLSSANLFVNATSAGMKGVDSVEIPLELLSEEAVIYDLVYDPIETNLIKEANELGHKASGGLSMLLYQGAESFEIWTGLDAPIGVMKKAIE